jgi:hypothetical protein
MKRQVERNRNPYGVATIMVRPYHVHSIEPPVQTCPFGGAALRAATWGINVGYDESNKYC